MRLSLSILVALLCHGVLFGVAAAVFSHLPRQAAAIMTQPLDVEIVSATPDPIAAAASPATGAVDRAQRSPPPRRRFHPVRRPPPVASLEAPAAAAAPVVAAAPTQIAPAADEAHPSMAARPAGGAASASATAGPLGTGAVTVAKARYRTNAKPDYPIASQRRREEGVVLLNVAVDAGGIPTAISLNRSSGHPLLDRAALDAVRRWTFEPARAGGVPMFSRVVVPVRFSLDDRP
ncbi:MAG TPA: energy transducer TonB, partial [Polyangia bacterium]|nr:energy transducer TonB [Polyangia bacterium]